jgi:hypothetical protein
MRRAGPAGRCHANARQRQDAGPEGMVPGLPEYRDSKPLALPCMIARAFLPGG